MTQLSSLSTWPFADSPHSPAGSATTSASSSSSAISGGETKSDGSAGAALTTTSSGAPGTPLAIVRFERQATSPDNRKSGFLLRYTASVSALPVYGAPPSAVLGKEPPVPVKIAVLLADVLIKVGVLF